LFGECQQCHQQINAIQRGVRKGLFFKGVINQTATTKDIHQQENGRGTCQKLLRIEAIGDQAHNATTPSQAVQISFLHFAPSLSIRRNLHRRLMRKNAKFDLINAIFDLIAKL
jgi:hypothetical protein